MSSEYELEQLAEVKRQNLVREAEGERAVEVILEARRLAEHQSEKHKNHLCHLAETRQMGRLVSLVGDGKQICGVCGRVAAQGTNLCEPSERASLG